MPLVTSGEDDFWIVIDMAMVNVISGKVLITNAWLYQPKILI